jgi:hypothetical protein
MAKRMHEAPFMSDAELELTVSAVRTCSHHKESVTEDRSFGKDESAEQGKKVFNFEFRIR